MTKRAEDIQNGIQPPRKGRRKRADPKLDSCEADTTPNANSTTLKNYQRSTHFITPSTDFPALFRQHFPEATASTVFCLSGLHTCGNLAPSCLQIFAKNAAIRTLCNVGCCYHLINEQFANDDDVTSMDDNQPNTASTDTSSATFGFPMSSYLRDARQQLGRNARMLASQSLNRTVSSQDLPSTSLFYRALLENLIQTGTEYGRNPNGFESIQVGRVKNVDRLTFAEYVVKCAKSKGVPDDLRIEMEALEPDVLNAMYAKCDLERRRMHLFYLLRMTFAPIVESTLMLDRLLYLRTDCRIEDAYLVRLFDPVVSPRCVAVVASKAVIE